MSATRTLALAAVLAAATLTGGVALWAQPGGPPAGPADPAPAKAKAKEAAADVAWGKAEGGLRLGLRPAGPTRLSVVIENVGPADAVLNLGIMLANGKTQLPTAVRLAVTDAAGKTRTFVRRAGGIAGRVDPFVVPLPAGGQYALPFALADLIDADNPGTPLAPGAYKVAAEFTGEKVGRTNADSGGLALMPYWTGTLRSGAVDVLVPADPPPAAGLLAPVEFRWGEAVKGLQAGIGVVGGRAAYRYGEEVPLRVNVRNVGTEPVAIQYSSALLRHTQPEVEDGAGRRVTGAGENRLLMPPAVRYVILTVDRELKAGEEMSFGLVPLKLSRAGAEGLGQSLELRGAPGEYTIRYTVPLGTGLWPVTGRLRFVVQPTDGGE